MSQLGLTQNLDLQHQSHHRWIPTPPPERRRWRRRIATACWDPLMGPPHLPWSSGKWIVLGSPNPPSPFPEHISLPLWLQLRWWSAVVAELAGALIQLPHSSWWFLAVEAIFEMGFLKPPPLLRRHRRLAKKKTGLKLKFEGLGFRLNPGQRWVHYPKKHLLCSSTDSAMDLKMETMKKMKMKMKTMSL